MDEEASHKKSIFKITKIGVDNVRICEKGGKYKEIADRRCVVGKEPLAEDQTTWEETNSLSESSS